MRKLMYGLSWLFVAVLFLSPLVILVSKTSLQNFFQTLSEPNTFKAVTNTLMVSFSVATVCVLLGLPLAWLITRTDLPFKDRFRTLFCLPYAVPPFVGAIGWIILANPTSGFLNTHLGLNLNIYSFFGLVWVEASFLFTFVLLTTMTSLDRMDSSLEEAARLSGASGLRVFKDISLPLLRPALLNGFMLCFLATAASFGVPALIGGPARIYLMTTQIYTFQRMGTENGFSSSISISALLMLGTFLLLGLTQFFLRKDKSYLVGGKSARASLIPLRQWKWLVTAALGVLLFLVFILPLLGVALSAFTEVQGSYSFEALGFHNFKRVLFETDETVRALSQSFGLGLAAAVVCTFVAFFLAYFPVRTNWKSGKLLPVLISLPFSTPGTVLALAMILSFSQGVFGVGPALYNTLGLILMAYVVKYQSLSFKTLEDGYAQIHPSLEEAARVSGATWWTTLRTIYFPLLTPAMVAAAFFVFMPVVSELTMTILLTGPGLETIGTLIFQMQEYSDIGGGASAVLSVIVVATIFTLNFLLKVISRGRYGL